MAVLLQTTSLLVLLAAICALLHGVDATSAAPTVTPTGSTTTLGPGQGKGSAYCLQCGNDTDTGAKSETISRCAFVKTGGSSNVDEFIFQCECREPNFKGNGTTCNNVDECAINIDNCDNHANCTDTLTGFSCTCDPGYSGDGVECKNIDECKSDVCGGRGKCDDTEGSYTCTCYDEFGIGKKNYKRGNDSTQCVDVDECLDKNGQCEEVCKNNNGSYACGCFDGRKPVNASLTVIGVGDKCEDINECSNSSTCGANNDCKNLDPAKDSGNKFECACKKGYELADKSNSNGNCTDIDECAKTPPHDCSSFNNTICHNTVPSVECICIVGFEGKANSAECKNVNECAKNISKCDTNAICTDNIGSYSCRCKKGYKGDGFTCTDIDECVENINNCSTNADCTNFGGGYTCKCIYGFTGDGRNCTDLLDNLRKDAFHLSRYQLLIKVHMLDNQRQQLQNEHEQLLRRCAKQNLKTRDRRDVIEVSDAAVQNAELWIATLEERIGQLKLENHALRLSCPESTTTPAP